MASGPPSYRGLSPPPPYEPYESRPASPRENQPPPPPAFADHSHARQPHHTTERERATTSPPAKPHEDPDAEEPTEGSAGKRRSLVQAYKDKRRAKEAARKVDLYERLYGFVPKNVMTEAEWRDARGRVPKTKVPFRARGKGMSALALGGAPGG